MWSRDQLSSETSNETCESRGQRDWMTKRKLLMFLAGMEAIALTLKVSEYILIIHPGWPGFYGNEMLSSWIWRDHRVRAQFGDLTGSSLRLYG